MSSVLRSVAGVPTKDSPVSTKFVNLTTLSYFDYATKDGEPLPVPFTCDNGVLDVRVQNGVQTNLLDDISGSLIPFNFTMVRQMGGSVPVRSLGSNFVVILQNQFPSDDGKFEIYIPGIMTKVQMPTNQFLPASGNPFENNFMGQFSVFGVTTTPPPSDDFNVTGSEADAYGTFWVFQSPLTVKFVLSGVKQYVTFTTTFTKNIFIS